MKKVLLCLSFIVILPSISYANKVVGQISKKGIVTHFKEEKVKNFFVQEVHFQSVTSISIVHEDGQYALHVLGIDERHQKVLIVKELKKENERLILPIKNDNNYMLTRHYCTGVKVQDNHYNMKGVTQIHCECADPYDDKLYNHTILTDVGFEYLAFYNAF